MNPNDQDNPPPTEGGDASLPPQGSIPVILVSGAPVVTIQSFRERQTKWDGFWKEHQRKATEEPDWPLEERLNSWAHLNREYTKLRQGGQSPSPAGSEVGMPKDDLDNKRLTQEIDTFQALANEKTTLNVRLDAERNTTIQAWHDNWEREREELSSGTRTPAAERAEVELENLKSRISMLQGQLAKLPEEEQRLQTRLDELKQSVQDLAAQEALDEEIAELRSAIAPLKSRLDREGFGNDDRRRLAGLNEKLTAALARNPERLREELEAQLLRLRGSIENLSMGQLGRREELMQELRELRNSQRQIIRDSRDRLEIQIGAAQSAQAGGQFEAERTRLDADLTQAKTDASAELLQLLQVGHELRQTWLTAQDEMIPAANALLDGHQDIDYWRQAVGLASARITELHDGENAFGNVLGQSAGAALQAVEAVEGTALTRMAEVDEFFRQQQQHHIIVQAIRLFQKWEGRSLETNDLQQMQEEVRAFRESRVNRLAAQFQNLENNRNILEGWSNVANAWTTELQSIPQGDGWRQTFRDQIADLPQQLNDYLDEAQTILGEMTGLQAAVEQARQAPAPTSAEELRHQLVGSLRLEAEASAQLYARFTQASSDAIELAKFAKRLENQKARLASLQAIREVDTRNVRRLNEAHQWASISAEVRDSRMQNVGDGRAQLENLEQATLAVFDNLRDIDDGALTSVTQPLEARIGELSNGVNALSDELNERDFNELNRHLDALPDLQNAMNLDRRTTISQLGLRLRGAKIQVEDVLDERRDLFTEEVLALADTALEDFEKNIPEGIELKSAASDWLAESDSLLNLDSPTDVQAERAALLKARELMTQHEQLKETRNRLETKHFVLSEKAKWLKEQCDYLAAERNLRDMFNAVNADVEARLSEELEGQRRELAGRIQHQIDQASALRKTVLTSCKRIFSEDDVNTVNLAGSTDEHSDDIWDTHNELNDDWGYLQDDIADELEARSALATQVQELSNKQKNALETQKGANQALEALANELQDQSIATNIREQFTKLQARLSAAQEHYDEGPSLSDLKTIDAELKGQDEELKQLVGECEELTQLARTRIEAARLEITLAKQPQQETFAPPSSPTQTGGVAKSVTSQNKPQSQAEVVHVETVPTEAEEQAPSEQRRNRWERFKGWLGSACCLGVRERSRRADKAPAESRQKYQRLPDERSDNPDVGTSTFGALTDVDRSNLQDKGIDPRSVLQAEVNQSVARAVVQLENGDFVYTLSSNQPDPNNKGKKVQTEVKHVIVPMYVVDNAGRLKDAENQVKGRKSNEASFIITEALLERRPSSRNSQSNEQGRGGRS